MFTNFGSGNVLFTLFKMDIVNEVLEKSAEEEKKYKPTKVNKHLELEYDLGTLLAIDENELNNDKLK